MIGTQLLLVLLALLSTGSLLWLAYRGWQRRGVRGAVAFTVMMLSVSIWSLFYALELASNDFAIIRFAHAVKYIGIAAVPVTWFIFAGQFTGRIPNPSWRLITSLSIFPTISLFVLWTTAQHGLFYDDLNVNMLLGFPTINPNYQIAFLLHTLYSYTLIAIGAILLFIASFRTVSEYVNQTQLLLLAVLIPTAGNLITILDFGALSSVDIAPILFVISGFLFEPLLRQPNQLGAMPIAYSSIIANLPDAVIVLGRESRVLDLNKIALDFMQIEKQDILGKRLSEKFPDLKPLISNYSQVMHAQDEIEVLERVIDLRIMPLYDNADNLQGRLLVLRDITKSKQIETALYANERRYQSLFENSNDAILILDFELTILIANPQTANMLGTDLPTLLLEDVDGVVFLSPDEELLLYARIEQLKQDIPIGIYETYFIREDSTHIPVEVNLTLVRDTDGTPLHLQMIARDISERVEAQAMLQKRYDQLATLRTVAQVLNSSLDLNHVLQMSLDEAVRLSAADAGFIAITNADEVRVSKVAGAYNENIIGEVLHFGEGIVGRVLATQTPEFVLHAPQDDDYKQDLEQTKVLMAFPLLSQTRLVGLLNLESFDANGFDKANFEFMQLLASRIAIAVDNARLYDYVQGQLDELQGLYEELRGAEALKTDMMRLANHDLKNPLGVAIGYVDMLQMDSKYFSSVHREYLISLEESLERVETILQDFLSVEAIEERSKGVTMNRVDLVTLAKRAIQEYQKRLDAKSLSLDLDMESEGLLLVKADEAQLYEAMTNLISNAIKYTPKNGKIRIDTAITPRLEALFAVHDNGYGIPEDRQNRLFEPFFRSKTVETATIEGTGLGLHLVKNIIERHRGEMIFNSVYRQGSTFGFTIPIDQTSEIID